MSDEFYRELRTDEDNGLAVIGNKTRSGPRYDIMLSRNITRRVDVDELISTLQEAKIKTEGDSMMAGFEFGRTKLGAFAVKETGAHFASVQIHDGRIDATNAPLEVLQAAIEKYNSLSAEEQGLIEPEDDDA